MLLTKMVIRVLDERWTTRRRDMIMLTAMPTSTSQIMVKKNVRAIRDRSIHARILAESNQYGRAEGVNDVDSLLPEIIDVVWCLCK